MSPAIVAQQIEVWSSISMLLPTIDETTDAPMTGTSVAALRLPRRKAQPAS
jgi:hypothetical protein